MHCLVISNPVFLQIINHGIDKEVLNNIRAAMSGIFELTADEKQRYSMAANDVQGHGQAFVVSEEQKLDWSDLMFLTTLPTEMRKIKSGRPWYQVSSMFFDLTSKRRSETSNF